MKSKLRITVLLLLIVVATAGLLGRKFLLDGVDVKVINATGSDIHDLRIKFTGGTKSTPIMESAGTFSARVNPSGESDLIVEYAGLAGTRHTNVLDVYIEHNYSGTIRITIQPGGNIEWKDETKISTIW